GREFIEDVVGTTNRPSAAQVALQQDLWYMVYKDEEGTVHTVKGTTENIRRAYREGLLGDAANIRAARSKQGPFQALRGHAEFRDLVIGPSAPAHEAPAVGAILSPASSGRGERVAAPTTAAADG